MAIAIIPYYPIDNLAPTSQILFFPLFKSDSLRSLRAAFHPPAQPLNAKSMNEEIEQSRERYADNRV
jgi:hypothetical protein